jgi:hypothetical protein
MRPYSKLLLESLKTEKPTLGQQLARTCIAANLPITCVAHALEVTRMAIHSWYRGSEIRGNNKKMIEVFMTYLDRDTANGVLPVKDLDAAKAYIEDLTGIPMK